MIKTAKQLKVWMGTLPKVTPGGSKLTPHEFLTTKWGLDREKDLIDLAGQFKSLEDKKSFIAFTVHDNIVIDLHDDEKYLLPQLVKMFSDTELGNFLVNTKVGANYGSLKAIKIK